MGLVGQFRCHPGGGAAVDRVVSFPGAVPEFLVFEDDLSQVWTRVDRIPGEDVGFVAVPVGFNPLFDALVDAAVGRVLEDGGERLQLNGWDPSLVVALIRSSVHDEVLKGLLVAKPIGVADEP